MNVTTRKTFMKVVGGGCGNSCGAMCPLIVSINQPMDVKQCEI